MASCDAKEAPTHPTWAGGAMTGSVSVRTCLSPALLGQHCRKAAPGCDWEGVVSARVLPAVGIRAQPTLITASPWPGPSEGPSVQVTPN